MLYGPEMGLLVMQELSYQCSTLLNTLKILERTVKGFDSALVAFFIFLQLTCPISLTGWESWSISPAEAVLYSPETKIPRTGELALRRAIPANTDMKAIQVRHFVSQRILFFQQHD